MDEIVKLKEKYLFRVLLDESNSLGVLGSSGRGLTEYCGVPVCFEFLCFGRWVHVLTLDASMHSFKIVLLFVICGYMLQVEKIDIITAAMGHALATEGGFCTGSTRVIDHQVWKCDVIYSH